MPGIATVPLGSYNTLDREVGTGVWGADWLPYAWAPEGQSIVFHASDRRHLRAVPFPSYLGAETIERQVRRGYPGDEHERRMLSLLRVGTRAIEPTALEAPGRRGISDVQWSPSGRLLIDQVFVIDPDAQAPSPMALTPDIWDVAGERGAATLIAHSGTQALYFTGTGGSPYERHVYRLAAGDRTPVALTSLPGVHVPVLSPNGRHLASLWSDDVTPPELLVGEARPGAMLTRVTTSPSPEFAAQRWVRARHQTFTNRVDGVEVHARILEPASLDRTTRHPVIFGPVSSNTVRHRWGGLTGTLQQYLVQQGYIVVQVDTRGSVGYGRRFREAFLMDNGGKDLDDLQAVVDGLTALPYVDGQRMGIWGSSYGGLRDSGLGAGACRRHTAHRRELACAARHKPRL